MARGAECYPQHPTASASGRVTASEQVPDVQDHIWEEVNAHLGTDAHSFPEVVEQLGVMRFGHRPKVADHVLWLRPDPLRSGTPRLRHLRV